MWLNSPAASAVSLVPHCLVHVPEDNPAPADRWLIKERVRAFSDNYR